MTAEHRINVVSETPLALISDLGGPNQPGLTVDMTRIEFRCAQPGCLAGFIQVTPPEQGRTVLDSIERDHVQRIGSRRLVDSVTDQPTTTTDCRTPEGVTVGLVDAIITVARVLVRRDLTPNAVREALADLRQDEDVAALLGLPFIVAALRCEPLDLTGGDVGPDNPYLDTFTDPSLRIVRMLPGPTP